tara:strand:+ start:397 stop:903 length:507 start_codon:yes stop_codon:yes gene_type:complete
MDNQYSGRVDISDYSGGVPFELHQNMGVNQNRDFSDSLKNIHSDNELSNLFFSRINIDFVQQKIIDEIYRQSREEYRIAKQSEEALEIVMRAMYLQHSRNLPCKIEQQVKELNKHVLDYCIPNIMTNIRQYIGYINDVNSPRTVMENPIDTSSKINQLENNLGFINFQ